MPIYEYVCCKCDNQFEALIRSQKDTQELECPKCRHKKVNKIFSTFATAGTEKGPKGGGSHSCGSCGGGTCSSCH